MLMLMLMLKNDWMLMFLKKMDVKTQVKVGFKSTLSQRNVDLSMNIFIYAVRIVGSW